MVRDKFETPPPGISSNYVLCQPDKSISCAHILFHGIEEE